MKEYLSCVMDIGEQMLLCGAEVHRVEDSVRRMCGALGAARTDVFIITSSMVATVYAADGDCCTQTRRITGGGTDMERLHRLNMLSRRICTSRISPEEIRREYAEICAIRGYSYTAECISYAVIAGAFTLFFGGSPMEAFISLWIGLIIRFVLTFTERIRMNRIMAKFTASLTASVLGFLAVLLGIVPNIDMIMIGNIMVLIPGIGLTNALRDLFVGDSIAGLLRMIDAALNALAIAAGYILYMFTLGGMLS